MQIEFWVCALITAVSAGVSFSYALSGWREAGPAGRTASMYAFSRSLALLVVALAALPARSTPFLAAIALAMIVVQAADAVGGSVEKDRLKTLGPAATAAANAAALAWVFSAGA